MFASFKMWIYGVGAAIVAGVLLYLKLLKKSNDDKKKTIAALKSEKLVIAKVNEKKLQNSSFEGYQFAKKENIKRLEEETESADLKRKINESDDDPLFDTVTI